MSVILTVILIYKRLILLRTFLDSLSLLYSYKLFQHPYLHKSVPSCKSPSDITSSCILLKRRRRCVQVQGSIKQVRTLRFKERDTADAAHVSHTCRDCIEKRGREIVGVERKRDTALFSVLYIYGLRTRVCARC